MKLKTFIFGGAATIAIAGGITAAVHFSNISQQTTPYLRVLTRETYNRMKAQQGLAGTDNKTVPVVSIDYGALPTSGVSFMDALTQDKISGNAFIITTGSEAFPQTRKMLYGQEPGNNGEGNKVQSLDASATMLQLYNLFYNPENENYIDVEQYADSMTFYSFMDIVYCQKVIEAENLLQYRRTQLGNKDPEPQGDDSGKALVAKGYSRLWSVPVKDEESKKEDLPVVKSSSGSAEKIDFNYEPTNAFYEFRPNNGIDTKYEKVYFRDQQEVNLFNDTLSWASSFAGTYLSGDGLSFTKEGSLICAKKEDGIWKFKGFLDFGSETLASIIDFYSNKKDNAGPEGDTGTDSGSSDTATPPSDGSSSSAPAAYSTMPIISEKKN